MLICDTHADTLYRMQYTKSTDITLKRLIQPGHTWVQALALFVGGNGLKGDDRYLIDRELENFELLKKKGFHQIHRIEEAQPDRANVLLTIEGGEVFGSWGFAQPRWSGTMKTCWRIRRSRAPITA